METSTPSSQQSADQVVSATSTPTVPVVSEYSPNYKYTLMDKEHEFDEFLRPVVKSKEHEEKLRDLYTKANGLDQLKFKNNKILEENKTYKGETEKLQSAFNTFQTYIKNNDLDSLFEAAGIEENKVLNWVKAKIEYSEMDSEQKRAYDEAKNFQKRSYSREEQYEQLQTQYQEVRTQQRNFELDQVLSKPEVQSVVKAYNDYAQSKGSHSFRDEVIRRGKAHYRETGEDLPAEVIASEMVKFYSGMVLAPSAPQEQVKGPFTPNRPSVIPVVGGGNTSPIHRAVNSIEDLIKIKNEKYGT